MPIIAKINPPVDTLKNEVKYNEITGLFTWLINKKGPIKIGMTAGAKRKDGYISIRINGEDYLAHRLAWLIYYGELSEKYQIDHINLCRSDNRIQNLRIASHGENSINTNAKSHNVSGLKGAHYHIKRKKYRSRITINGKQKWLGYFDTAEEAHAAYCKASIDLHGEFSRT